MFDLNQDNATKAKQHLLGFLANIQTDALADHEAGRAGRISGWHLCSAHCVDWRKGHEKMAVGLYNKLRWALLVAEGRTEEAARW